jgi:hypothetical protein
MNTPSSHDNDSSSSACDAFEVRLNGLLDERLDPGADTQLAGHVAVCESCRRRLRTSSLLLASFHSPRGGDVAPSLSRQWARRIADQHTQEIQVQPRAIRSPKKRRLRPSAWFLLLSTSAAAVAMAVTLQITLNRRSESANSIAASKATKSSSNGTKSSAPLPNSAMALSLAGPPTWEGYQEALKAWETAIDPEGTGRESIESSVEPLADSFRPVGHSFSTVLGGLRKTLPASRIRRPKTDDGALFYWERWSVV